MPRLSDQIVAEARTWEGVKFRHCGRNRFGVDCIGLIIKVAHELGLSTYDTKAYARAPDFKFLMREFKRELKKVSLGDAGHGDVLIMQQFKYPIHCGILEIDGAGRRWLIHAYEPYGKVVREPAQNHSYLHAFRFEVQ